MSIFQRGDRYVAVTAQATTFDELEGVALKTAAPAFDAFYSEAEGVWRAGIGGPDLVAFRVSDVTPTIETLRGVELWGADFHVGPIPDED